MKKSPLALFAALLLGAALVGCAQPGGASPQPTTSIPSGLPSAPTNTGGSPKPSLEVPPPIY